MAKYDYIKLSKKDKLSEKELNALKNHINRKPDDIEQLIDNVYQNEPELTIEQQKKGFKYLYNLGFTPTGKERKNSPYGMRERYIVQNPQSITLYGFHDAGNWFNTFYVPIYSACGKDGTCMEYYVSGGKINIIG